MELKSIFDSISAFISFESIIRASIAFIVCFIVIKIINNIVSKALKKSKIDTTLHRFIKSVIKIVLYIIMAMIIAGTLGIEISSIVALFSVVGLAVSLAVQDSLANAMSGITILFTKPFSKGDFVELGGVSGTVDAVGIANTTLKTPDNKMIFIPNSTICTANIINYSHETTRRIEIKVTASYDAPTKAVKDALAEAASICEDKILKDPALFTGLNTYGESSVEYVIRFWVNSSDYWDVYFAVNENIREVFNKRGIEMTYNHIIVHNK